MNFSREQSSMETTFGDIFDASRRIISIISLSSFDAGCAGKRITTLLKLIGFMH
jgi:hypothetical protein